MSVASLGKHSDIVGDGNSLVRQHEDLNFTNGIISVTSSGSNYLTNTTTSPFYNLTPAQQQICKDHIRYCDVRIYVDVYIIGPLCLAGIVGNLLAILALRLDHSNRTVTFLLQALAVADNAYLVSSLLVQTLKSAAECSSWLKDFKEPFQFTEPYLWPLASIAQTTTVWLTVLVTVDRYLAICRPFESMRHQVSTRAKRAVYIIALTAIVYNIPRFFEKVVIRLPDHCLRVFRYVAWPSWLRKNDLYVLIYKTVLFFIFRMVGPLFVLVVLNIKLIQTLRRARRDHAQLTQTANQRTNNYFNLILVTVVTVFIVCQTPDFLVRIAMTIKTYSTIKFDIYWPNTFSNMMLTINSSVNCLIYCLTGRKFRQILYRILCRHSCRRKKAKDDMRFGNSEGMSCSTNNKRHTSFSAVNETVL